MNKQNNTFVEPIINTPSNFNEVTELENINSVCYKFNNHTFKVCTPISYNIECENCHQYMFKENCKLALLDCRHLNHYDCATSNRLIGYECQHNEDKCKSLGDECQYNEYRCNFSCWSIGEYTNYNIFRDNIILNCIEKHDENKCYLTIKYGDLQEYYSTNPEKLLQAIFSNTIKTANEKYKNNVAYDIYYQLKDLAIISADNKDKIYDATNTLVTDILKTQEVPRESFAEFTECVEDTKLSCPYPSAKFTHEPAKGFLARNKTFLVDFLNKEIKPWHSADFMSNPISNIVKDSKDGIKIKGYKLYSNSDRKKYVSFMHYTAERIEIGETGADAFAKLMIAFNTDFALLNFIKTEKYGCEDKRSKSMDKSNRSAFCNTTNVYFTQWCGIKDYIKISVYLKEHTLKLSSFLNADKRMLDIPKLSKQLEEIGVSLELLLDDGEKE